MNHTKLHLTLGFPVIVHKGVEVTEAKVTTLDPKEVTRRVNGPHHDAEWARYLRRPRAMPIVTRTIGGRVTVHC